MKDGRQYHGTMRELWMLRAEEAVELGYLLFLLGVDRVFGGAIAGVVRGWKRISVWIRHACVRSCYLLRRFFQKGLRLFHSEASTLRVMALQTAVLAVLFLFLTGLVFGIVYTVSAREQTTYTKYITCITIEDGDSLWRIAERYLSDDSQDIPSFIEEIRFCNNLHGDEIHAGEKLLIPYFVPVSGQSRTIREETDSLDTLTDSSVPGMAAP